jgi:hypothetical protein
MDAKQDDKIALAVSFLQLADISMHKISVKEAMKLAGFSKKEIENTTRAKEAAVRRAYQGMLKMQPPKINLPVQEVFVDRNFPISPFSKLKSAPSKDSLTTSKSILKTNKKIVEGMKVVRQTSHHAHVMAQNASILRKLRRKRRATHDKERNHSSNQQ